MCLFCVCMLFLRLRLLFVCVRVFVVRLFVFLRALLFVVCLRVRICFVCVFVVLLCVVFV